MEPFATNRLTRFFRQITDQTPTQPATSLLVTHLLAERPAFVAAVHRVAPIAAVLPKPKTIHPDALAVARRDHIVDALTRDQFADPDTALTYLESRAAHQLVVLLDVGGYFAPTLREVCDRFTGRILGVVEDTENGYRRYLDLGKPPCPIFSVARSPLKEPEDLLVGQSVVFSTEALLRSRGDILPGRCATVLGFGKLGSSIARALHAKGVRVTVYDTDPVRATQALSQGFHVAGCRRSALADAGLVMCATGNRALHAADFALLPNGCYVASVTSAEDELDLRDIDDLYQQTRVSDHITRYCAIGQYFYLLAAGNAVNFIHGASVGAFIHLVQAEILLAAATLTSGNMEPGFHEVLPAERRMIADAWLATFNPTGAK